MITDRVLHTTYLPPESQIYFNYFTKESYEGGKTITRPYGLGDIPVFVKAGGIIPLDGGQLENGIKNPEVLTIEIFPGNSNSFSLYEDDGVSESYKENKHYISEIKWTWGQHDSLEITLPENVPDYITKNIKINLVFIKSNMKPNVSIQRPSGNFLFEEHVLKAEIPSIVSKTLLI